MLRQEKLRWIGRRRLEDGLEKRQGILRGIAQHTFGGSLLGGEQPEIGTPQVLRDSVPRPWPRREWRARVRPPRPPDHRRRAGCRALPARDTAASLADSTSPSSIDSSCCARSSFNRLPVPRSWSSTREIEVRLRHIPGALVCFHDPAARDDRQVRIRCGEGGLLLHLVGVRFGDQPSIAGLRTPCPSGRRVQRHPHIEAAGCLVSRRDRCALELDAPVQRRRRHIAVDLKPGGRSRLGQ